MYENPSAGKFDPPPPPVDPTAPTPMHKRWWFYVLLIVTSYPASHWLLSGRSRGSMGWVAPIFGLAAMAVNAFLTRKRHDEITGGDPYTPPSRLTR
jgi:hypothetical protein